MNNDRDQELEQALNKMTDDQLAVASAMCNSYEWPPTLSQFKPQEWDSLPRTTMESWVDGSWKNGQPCRRECKQLHQLTRILFDRVGLRRTLWAWNTRVCAHMTDSQFDHWWANRFP